MNTRAAQYVNVEEPGFVWNADVGSPLMSFAGRDSYLNGSGRMLIAMYCVFRSHLIADSDCI